MLEKIIGGADSNAREISFFSSVLLGLNWVQF